MKKYRKLTALAASLLIAANTCAVNTAFIYATDADSAVTAEDPVVDIDDDAANEPMPISETAEESAVDDDTDLDDGIGKVTSEGDWLFYYDEDGNAHINGCAQTEENVITVPDTVGGYPVTEIDAETFIGCNAEKIVIPASVVYVSAENPFLRCENLKEIEVDSASKDYTSVDGVIYSKDKKKLVCYPQKKPGETFKIPDGVVELGIGAIYNTALKEITLPDSLAVINRHSLCYNAKIKKLDMSKTQIETIESMAFTECTTLKEVLFPETLTEIKVGAFMNCCALASVELPQHLRTIGQSAFMNTAMLKVEVPPSVESIGYCAFGYDADENAVEGFLIIGENNTAASRYAQDVDSENDYENHFAFMTFDQAAAAEAYAALDVKKSGDYEYAAVDGGISITYCTSDDTEIIVPQELDGQTVTSIYTSAFLDCNASKIVLPETVKKIGRNVFPAYVESITIPGGCTEIEGEEPFLMYVALREINVTEGDGAFSSLDGVLYNSDGSTLLAYPAMKQETSFKAPDSCKEIASSGFCYNQFLQDLDLNNVEVINDYACEGCQKIVSVKLSENTKSVGVNAFLGCSALKSIRIPDGISSISSYAFGYDYDASVVETAQQNAEELAEEGVTTVMPYSVIEDFTIYANEDTLGYRYATDCGINVISGTVDVGGKNLTKSFVYVIGGLLAAVVVAICGVFIGKKSAKKKEKGESK